MSRTGQPFVPMDPRWWSDMVDRLRAAGPLTAFDASMDMRWWEDQVRVGREPRVPGRRELAKRWGWNPKGREVRNFLRSEVWREGLPGALEGGGPPLARDRSAGGPHSERKVLKSDVEVVRDRSAGGPPAATRANKETPPHPHTSTPSTTSGPAELALFDEDPHPDRPDPTLELFESLVTLGVEHGHLRASRPPDPSVKVSKARTRLQELKALERDEGRELVRKAWAWVLSSADAAWWREKRKGALLLDTFMVRENFRRMAESALESEQAQGAGGEVIPLHSPFQAILRCISGHGTRGFPRTPTQAHAMLGDTWELHQAALRVLGDWQGPEDTKGTIRGWIRIAQAASPFERSQLERAYDEAFKAAASRASA